VFVAGTLAGGLAGTAVGATVGVAGETGTVTGIVPEVEDLLAADDVAALAGVLEEGLEELEE
jgi:hypothetical protein